MVNVCWCAAVDISTTVRADNNNHHILFFIATLLMTSAYTNTYDACILPATDIPSVYKHIWCGVACTTTFAGTNVRIQYEILFVGLPRCNFRYYTAPLYSMI